MAWAVDLPEADDGELVATADGGVVVSTRRFLAAVTPAGQVAWLVDAGVGLLGSPVLLPSGRVVRAEDGLLVTRDLATGASVGSVTATGLSAVAATPDGDLLIVARTPEREPVLRRLSPGGAVQWTRRLDDAFASLVVAGDAVVVADRGALRGYDLSGAPRWFAGGHGFGLPPAPRRSAAPVARGPLVALPGGRVLAELAEPDGYGWHVFDPGADTVTRVDSPVGMHHPVTAVPGGAEDGGVLLAAVGPAEEVEEGRQRSSVVLAELSGAVRWSHPVSAEPRALLPGGAGTVVVVCSPGLDRWQKYHHWYDLSGECFVRCVGAAGEQRWTWPAPVPLTYRAAASGDTTYVAAPGRLWALR
ncbi:PQQ-binding-like beta-propeller repeat protein [Actinomycetes bacterium KLBMP 9797]